MNLLALAVLGQAVALLIVCSVLMSVLLKQRRLRGILMRLSVAQMSQQVAVQSLADAQAAQTVVIQAIGDAQTALVDDYLVAGPGGRG